MENSKAYIKFIISLLIFGSNGLVASLIDLSSHQIVLLRTLIGGIFLSAILLYQKKPLAALKNKRHFFCSNVWCINGNKLAVFIRGL